MPIQRHESEGITETRFSRYFRVGGVLPASDGYVELLTLESRQFEGLLAFMGNPEWASPEMFSDPATHGPELNRHMREWFAQHTREWLYAEGQAHGVPIAPYYTPAEVFQSPQQRERGFYSEVDHPATGPAGIYRRTLPTQRDANRANAGAAAWRAQRGGVLRSAGVCAAGFGGAGAGGCGLA